MNKWRIKWIIQKANLKESWNMNDYSIPNERLNPGPDDARGKKMEVVGLVSNHNGVTCVVSSLTPYKNLINKTKNVMPLQK